MVECTEFCEFAAVGPGLLQATLSLNLFPRGATAAIKGGEYYFLGYCPALNFGGLRT